MKSTVKCILILAALVYQMNASCSRLVLGGPDVQQSESQDAKERMKDFLDGGVGKELDIHNTSADEIISTAREFLGVPHCMGGTTVKCMDCSGLMVAVFARYDIRLPHNSEEQARYGKILSSGDSLIKGDLVFFCDSYATTHYITHSGIYIGDNQFIHTSTSKGVTVTSMDDAWWKGRFVFGTRVLK